jgi:hypothetical protein
MTCPLRVFRKIHVALFASVALVAALLGCSDELDGPTPRLTATIDPGVACRGDMGENAAVITTLHLASPDGTFSPLPVNVLDEPTLRLPRVFLRGPGGETELGGVRFLSTKAIEVDVVPTRQLAAGSYEVLVQNPNGKRSAESASLRVVEPPRVDAVTVGDASGAAQICTAKDNLLTVTGAGFRPEDAPPTVQVLSCSDPADLASCTTVAATLDGVAVASATELSGTLAGGDAGLPPGTYAVRVLNPEAPPCVATRTGALIVVPNPTLSAVAPASICPTTTTVTLTGSGFHDATTATIGGEPLEGPTVADDATLTGAILTGLAPGDYDVTITIPEGCSATLPMGMHVVAAPTIAAIEPASVCGAGAVTITGSGYGEGTTATIGDQPVDDLLVVDPATLTGTAPLLPAGDYDVAVTIPEGCSATLPAGVSVHASDLVVSTILASQGWNGIDNPVSIYGAGFAPGDTVRLLGAAVGGGDLDLTQVVVDPSGTRIDATVPAGGAPGGPYDVVVTSAEGCPAVLAGGFTILGDPSIVVSAVVPPFAWTGGKTPLTITGSGFVSTPRAFLIVPTMSPTLRPLKSTSFIKESSITSVVPAGLDVGGPYDLAIINPDGGGGLLPAAVVVTTLPPPTIDDVSPGLGTTQNPTLVTIAGCNLRAPIEVLAIDPAGATTDAPVTQDPVCDGAPTCPDGSGRCTMSATVPTTAMAVGPYLVRVENQDELTWGQWSVFVVAQPSAKLGVWQASTSALVTARRFHAGVTGRIDNASRYLYAIGGDTGAAGAAIDTIDVAPIDVYGGVGTVFEQRYRLGVPRSRVAAAQSGGYVYVLGGTSDGAAPLASIERAKILLDDDVPAVDDPTVGGGALPAGTWYYRVAAVKGANDPDNPSGETLPSDEVVVSLAFPGGVSLTWTPVPGAVAYRVYRTEAADGVSSTEVFLAEAADPATSYTDDGSVAVDLARRPLARGSTGVWVTLAGALQHARFDHRVALAHDPMGAGFVYAVGGFGACAGGPNAAMSCYELASLSSDGATLGAFTSGTQALKSARRSFGLVVGESSNAPQIPAGSAYLFASGGVGSTSALEVASVTTGGQLGPFANLGPPNGAAPGSRNGFGMLLVNDAMYLNGGVSGTSASGPPLDDTQFSVQLGNNLPERTSFSSSSAHMTTARYGHALLLESGFLYALGGSTDAALATASASIEMTIQ